MKKRGPEGGEWDDSDDISDAVERKKIADQQQRKEGHRHGFGCDHCNNWVPIHEEMGTHNRNHCPHCLWSKHMDAEKPGDRKSDCKQGMKPIALTFKGESEDRYATSSEQQLGELMLVHECVRGDQVRINRIAADDNPDALLAVYYEGQELPGDTQRTLRDEGITVAPLELSGLVMGQLFGPGEFQGN